MKLLKLFVICLACKAALHGVENEFWLQEFLDVELSEQVGFYLSVGQRWDRDVTRLHHQFIETGFVFSYGSWDFIPSFRESYRKHDDGHEPEENPRFAIIKSWEFSHLEILDRNQIEYRSRNEHVLYRNQLMFAFSISDDIPLVPYISDEIFLKHFTDLRQNRLQIGIEASWDNFLVADFCYMFRLRKNDHRTWYGSHVWALNFVLNI